MKPLNFVTATVALVTVVTFGATSASAQRQRSGGGSAHRGAAVGRAAPAPRAGGGPQGVAPSVQAGGPARVAGSGRSVVVAPGGRAVAVAPSGRAVASAPRGVYPSHAVVAPRGVYPRGVAVAPYHPYYAPRYYAPHYYAPGYYAPRYYAPHYYAPHYYAPYYTFRPQFSIGFGFWVGYPVVYPAYVYPSYGAYPSPGYGYPAAPPPPGYGANVQPYGTTGQPYGTNGQPYGTSVQPSTGCGLSFDVTPATAEVFIDGNYAGEAGTFGPTSEPLRVTPGRHRVEMRALGYQTVVFDVNAIAGEVVPYQGTMQAIGQ